MATTTRSKKQTNGKASKAKQSPAKTSPDHKERGAGTSKTTINHNQIRRWVEARGGHPATVRNTEGKGDPGLLRIDFPGYSGKRALEEISWDEFFQKFDEKGLAFLYQDKTATGKQSRFNKLVSRKTAKARARG